MNLKIIILLCLALTQVFSSEKLEKQTVKKKPPAKVYYNYFGFAAGGVAGNGISFRKWFPSGTGYQINAVPFYNEKIYEEKSTDSKRWDGFEYDGYFSLGGLYLKSMYRGRKTNVVLYTGGNWQSWKTLTRQLIWHGLMP